MASILFDFNLKRLLIDGAETELLEIIKSVKELVPHFKEIKIVSGTEGQKTLVRPKHQSLETKPVEESFDPPTEPSTPLPPIRDDGTRETSLPNPPAELSTLTADQGNDMEPIQQRAYRRRVGAGGAWQK